VEAAEDMGEKAQLFEMDVSSSETWRRYDILVTPTILIFQEGQVKEKLPPLPKKEEIETALST
jgi:hypothetical protein